MVAAKSPDVAPWITPRVCCVCANCGAVSDTGLLGANAADDEEFPYLYLCRDCIESLVTVYVASSPNLRLIRVHVVEMPLAPPPSENISTSDITVSLTFDPQSDPRSVDIQVSPEPASGAAALELIELAAVRACEYLSSYRGAAADDEEVAS